MEAAFKCKGFWCQEFRLKSVPESVLGRPHPTRARLRPALDRWGWAWVHPGVQRVPQIRAGKMLWVQRVPQIRAGKMLWVQKVPQIRAGKMLHQNLCRSGCWVWVTNVERDFCELQRAPPAHRTRVGLSWGWRGWKGWAEGTEEQGGWNSPALEGKCRWCRKHPKCSFSFIPLRQNREKCLGADCV